MLKTGAQHLESLRDGRAVYLGNERVADVTAHPAFAEGARTVAGLYDIKRAPENVELASYEEGGELFSSYYLRCRTQDDLRKRSRTHKLIADFTHGLFGRSPDHVAGLITGIAMNAAVLDRAGKGYADNLLRHFEKMRREDSYAAFAVVPPPGTRHPEIFAEERRADPGLRIVAETDDGLVVSGMKMLATGAVYANEILIGNLTPLAPEFKAYAVTTCLPCNAPGLSLWSRRPYAAGIANPMDYPLSHRFDESDCVVVCKDVKVPWETVFVKDDAELSRNCYITTPANCFSNHQSNVRFWAKMSLVVGLASRIAQSTGLDRIPAVREQLGRLAALEATIGALVAGQIEGYERWPGGPDGYVCFNRRYMYAALNWCQEHHTEIIDQLRGLMGANPLMMPGDASLLSDPSLAAQFEDCFRTPFMKPIDRWKLLKIGWDLVGSEFAGRHQLYERFYAGTSAIVRSQNHREAPWDEYHRIVDDLIARIPAPVAKA
jgi:4-hydroxyphenylacetate 3-monooxygenase